MKILVHRPVSVFLAVITFASLGFSAHVFAQSTLSATSKITGGSAGTGSFLWNAAGHLISSSQELSLELPADTAKAIFWDATKGSLFSGQWSASTVMGSNSTALGGSSAPGDHSFASGLSNTAGALSGAIGLSYAGGELSFATGFSYATNAYSSAFGASSAEGVAATSIGAGFAMGLLSLAGGESQAYGDYSTALGLATQANAYASFVIGRYNLGTMSPGGEASWLSADPIFEIGIGHPATAAPWIDYRANALTVYKDGTVIISKAQGDILMGDFGN
jgi:hypothetical protein